MRRRLAVLLGCLGTFAGAAHASLVHFVGEGDSITSLALEFYDDANAMPLLRAANGWPLEGDVELMLGEPVLIPECKRRVVEGGQTWADLAREELGTSDRAWLVAEANQAKVQEPPETGRIVTIPLLVPVEIEDDLRSTVKLFYPEATKAERGEIARLVKRLNPDLPQQRGGRGARALLPFFDVAIRPTKRMVLDDQRVAVRDPVAQEHQAQVTRELESLPELLANGAYVEVVVLASRVRGGTELTEAQRVTLHRVLGQAFVALDRDDLARAEFVALLALQPDFQFDQVTTSPTVLEVFERAHLPGRPITP
jgi:hypothetical protein